MKKKFLGALCLSMALAFTVPLAACGGGGEDLNEDGTWWSTTGELNKDANGNVVFDDVTLNLSTIVSGVDKVPFGDIIARFNAEYRGKININPVYLQGDNFEKDVTMKVQQNSNNAPDIIMLHQESLKGFLDYKVIQPYDLAMEETGIEIDLSAFAQGVNQYSKAGTEYRYGVPFDAASMVVYYNKDLLKEITGSDKAPQTRSELLSVCGQFKAKYPANYPISWESSGDFFCQYLMPTAVLQNGGSLYKEDLYADWYNNETQRGIYKDAIQSVRSYIDSGYAKLGVHERSGATDFVQNKSIFYVTMPWYREDIVNGYVKMNNIDQAAAEEKISGASVSGWFAMSNETSENAKKIFGDSHMFAMTKSVKDINKKAAVCEFVKWFTQSADIGAQWAEAGHVTLSNTIANSTTYTQNKNVVNFIDNWYPNLGSFMTMGITPYYSTVGENLRTLLSESLLLVSPKESDYLDLIKTKQNALNSKIDMLKM